MPVRDIMAELVELARSNASDEEIREWANEIPDYAKRRLMRQTPELLIRAGLEYEYLLMKDAKDTAEPQGG
jgi:hypothetical protein